MTFWAHFKKLRARAKLKGRQLRVCLKVVLAIEAVNVFVVVSPIEPTAAPAPVLEGHRYTEPGHPADVILEDRSAVLHLNGDTGILNRSTPHSREVVLERGELLAEVQHDDLRPFRVTVGRLVVQDVGTEFNILALGDKTRFSITQGEARLFEFRADGELVDPEVAVSPTSHRREPVTVTAGDLIDITHPDHQEGARFGAGPAAGGMAAWVSEFQPDASR